jgi:hypothetical protein
MTRKVSLWMCCGIATGCAGHNRRSMGRHRKTRVRSCGSLRRLPEYAALELCHIEVGHVPEFPEGPANLVICLVTKRVKIPVHPSDVEGLRDQGVAITSRYQLLKSALNAMSDRAYIGLVRYGAQHLIGKRANLFRYITTKRNKYAHEQEVRAFLWLQDPHAGINRHIDADNP